MVATRGRGINHLMVGARGAWRALIAAVAVALAVAGLVAAVAPAAAEARWSAPFDLAAPQTLDVLPPQLAIAADGSAAAAFGFQDVDTPGSSEGWLTLRAGSGAVSGPVAVAPARQILDLAYDGHALELLTGSSAAGQTCCSAVQAIPVGAGGVPGAPRTLVGGLTGATLGDLLTLADGQMLAAVATERGVWVVQSSGGDRFGGQHLLTGAGQIPEALAATPLGGGASLVAWTAARAGADPRTVMGATGTRRAAPHRARTLVTVPRGHRIDELGLARQGGRATVAWIETWYDAHGAYHSVVEAADLTPGAHARALSPANRLASGLQFAGDAAGDQVAAWESCTVNDVCAADAAVRRRGGTFGPARTLGATDAAQAPALAVGPGGQAVVGWIRGGDPMAATQATPGRGFGGAAVLSRAGYALDITVAAGRGRQALAAWSQGTLNPSVVGVSGF
jgi:hypothetical protein